MLALRYSNPHLAKKTDKELHSDIRRRVYESSVFEGSRLPKDYAPSVRDSASVKKSTKAR